jgi:hypothetical protein
MPQRAMPQRGVALAVMVVAGLVTACSIGLTAVDTPPPVASVSPTPSVTPSPLAGVCNPADFPLGVGPVETKQYGAPTNDVQYPPLTYYVSHGGATGHHYYTVCSSGSAASILAFMKASIPAGGWTILGSDATSLGAQKPTTPPTGYCYGLQMTVGQHPAYPGEWDLDLLSPASECA